MVEPLIGEIRLFSFNFNPQGWYYCNGNSLPIASHSTLFALIGTMYGGDGRSKFALPDLRGRAVIHKGRHSGSLYDWRMGQRGGAETQKLSVAEMPPHNHSASFEPLNDKVEATLTASTDSATQNEPSEGCYLAGGNDQAFIFRTDLGQGSVMLDGVSAGSTKGDVKVADAGSGKAFSLIQPVLSMNYCIAHVGIYPKRS